MSYAILGALIGVVTSLVGHWADWSERKILLSVVGICIIVNLTLAFL